MASRKQQHVYNIQRPVLRELRLAYMNPAQCDEALLVLYEEKLFFIFSVTIIRSSALLGDENMGNGKFIPHLSKKKTACHNSWALM